MIWGCKEQSMKTAKVLLKVFGAVLLVTFTIAIGGVFGGYVLPKIVEMIASIFF